MTTRTNPLSDGDESMQLSGVALRWLNDLSAQGILLTDEELNIRGWNNWLERHTGKSAEMILGRNLLEAYPDLATRRLDEYYRDALKSQVRMVSQRLHGYLLPMSPSMEGSAFNHMQQTARIAPLIEENQVVGTITIIDDVTERVERENRLVQLLANEKAARAEAEAANRAKDEFLAIVSHELRAPLNSILGWAQILRTTKSDEQSSAHGLKTIENNAKAQAQLIEDILDASRIITGKLRLDVRPVDLAQVIETAIDGARPAADAKSIQIKVVVDSRGALVSGDPNRLQQIVWNLLFNAIKFTGKSGQVEVCLQRSGSHVEVCVRDTGLGISAEFLPYVFDRFRQANSTRARAHGGLGLGLAIVRNLVELHGGSVHAHSDGEGRGAAFTVRLPLMAVHPADDSKSLSVDRAAEADRATINGKSSTLPPLDNVRVLVVDNEADAREILSIMLAEYGAKVTTATSTSEALEVLQEWKPDVLISDIGMPEEDGYALIKKIRALEPEQGGAIPAVAVTGYAGSDERVRLLSAGYQMHVTKPVELNELATLIAKLAGSMGKGLSA